MNKNFKKNIKKISDESDVVCNPESTVKLICIKNHTVKAPSEGGNITLKTYKVGDIVPRNELILKPTMWSIYEEE